MCAVLPVVHLAPLLWLGWPCAAPPPLLLGALRSIPFGVGVICDSFFFFFLCRCSALAGWPCLMEDNSRRITITSMRPVKRRSQGRKAGNQASYDGGEGNNRHTQQRQIMEVAFGVLLLFLALPLGPAVGTLSCPVITISFKFLLCNPRKLDLRIVKFSIYKRHIGDHWSCLNAKLGRRCRLL